MKAKICPECGNHNLESTLSCARCGRPLSPNTLAEVDEDKAPLVNTEIPKGAPAAEQLLGKELSSLMSDLLDDRSTVRCEAARALGRTDDSRVIEPLISALTHYDKNTREAAAEALGELGERRAITPLADAMKREHTNARRAMETALEKLGALQLVVEARVEQAKAEREEERDPGATMALGAIICVIGIIATAISYLAKRGGSYTIFYGMIVGGATVFLLSFLKFRRGSG